MPEPWFNVALEEGKNMKEWTKVDEIKWNQQKRQGEKHEFFQLAFDLQSSNGNGGDYYEFGCHRARTFRMAMLEAKTYDR